MHRGFALTITPLAVSHGLCLGFPNRLSPVIYLAREIRAIVSFSVKKMTTFRIQTVSGKSLAFRGFGTRTTPLEGSFRGRVWYFGALGTIFSPSREIWKVVSFKNE